MSGSFILQEARGLWQEQAEVVCLVSSGLSCIWVGGAAAATGAGRRRECALWFWGGCWVAVACVLWRTASVRSV